MKEPVMPSRTIKLGYPQGRGPNGRRLCRWCKKEVPVGRIHWCGQECVEEYLVRSNPGHARRQVEKRDRGVCSGCGVDTNQLKRVMRALGMAIWRAEHMGGRAAAKYGRWKAALLARFPWFRLGHLWEADHVVPVAEGGGSCGLENLRTLCLGCHRRATAQLAARLAEKRRGTHQETLFQSSQPEGA
jgi:hypothetical protein